MHAPEHGYYKIGYTDDVTNRRSSIQSSLPFALEVVCAWETYHYGKLEHAIHVRFEDNNIRGEWFKLSPEEVQECRQYTEDWLEKRLP